MAGQPPPLTTQPSGEQSPARTSDVPDELAALKADVDKLKNSRAARVATVLSIIATVFSVPLGVVNVRDAFIKKPDTSITGGSSVKLTYEPTRQTLKIAFELVLRNSGNKDDAIREINGKISDARTSLFAPFGANDLSCFGSAKQSSQILSVPKEGSTSTVCVGSIILGPLSRRVFEKSGTKLLTVYIHGDSRSTSLSECFPLDQQAATDLARTNGPMMLRIPSFMPCDTEEVK